MYSQRRRKRLGSNVSVVFSRVAGSSTRSENLQVRLHFPWHSPCPTATRLETHQEHRHGDVCRLPTGDFQCTMTCAKAARAPYCVVPGTLQPCRAKNAERNWAGNGLKEYATKGIMHTFWEPAFGQDSAREELSLRQWDSWTQLRSRGIVFHSFILSCCLSLVGELLEFLSVFFFGLPRETSL